MDQWAGKSDTKNIFDLHEETAKGNEIAISRRNAALKSVGITTSSDHQTGVFQDISEWSESDLFVVAHSP